MSLRQVITIRYAGHLRSSRGSTWPRSWRHERPRATPRPRRRRRRWRACSPPSPAPSTPAASDLADLRSAVRTAARVLGLPPKSVTAHPGALGPLLAGVVPAAHGLRPARWRNVRSLLGKALQLAGCRPPARPRRRSARPGLAASSPAGSRPRRPRIALGRLMRFCSARGIAPEAVDDAVLARFRRALVEGSLARKPQPGAPRRGPRLEPGRRHRAGLAGDGADPAARRQGTLRAAGRGLPAELRRRPRGLARPARRRGSAGRAAVPAAAPGHLARPPPARAHPRLGPGPPRPRPGDPHRPRRPGRARGLARGLALPPRAQPAASPRPTCTSWPPPR